MLFPQFRLVPSSCVLGSYSSSGSLCSMDCPWLLAVTGSCGCWVPNGSSSYLSFLWFLVVSSGCSEALGSVWLLGSWFPVGFLVPEAPQFSVVPWVHCSPHCCSGSLDYLWFLPLVTCGSSGSLWFLWFL